MYFTLACYVNDRFFMFFPALMERIFDCLTANQNNVIV